MARCVLPRARLGELPVGAPSIVEHGTDSSVAVYVSIQQLKVPADNVLVSFLQEDSIEKVARSAIGSTRQ